MRSVCIFCGSKPGNDPAYAAGARRLGRTLAEEGITLVYGGGHVGLMGVVADTILDAGGKVTGVIPMALVEREIAHPGVTDLRVVGSMNERKAVMSVLSEGPSHSPATPVRWKSSSRYRPGRNSASTRNRAGCSTWQATTIRWSHSSTTWSQIVS